MDPGIGDRRPRGYGPMTPLERVLATLPDVRAGSGGYTARCPAHDDRRASLSVGEGADHRVLIPCAFLLGAAFLTVCDTVARTVLAPTEIPVGVITAATGGPLFLLMLRRHRL